MLNKVLSIYMSDAVNSDKEVDAVRSITRQ